MGFYVIHILKILKLKLKRIIVLLLIDKHQGFNTFSTLYLKPFVCFRSYLLSRINKA